MGLPEVEEVQSEQCEHGEADSESDGQVDRDHEVEHHEELEAEVHRGLFEVPK